MGTKRLLAASTTTIATALVLLTIGQVHLRGQQEAAGLTKEQQKSIAEAARAYALAVAGNNEASLAYNELFQHALQGALKYRPKGRAGGAGGGAGGALLDARVVSPFARTREIIQENQAKRLSIFKDPTWLANDAKRVKAALADDPGRIFGGRLAKDKELPDCVAVQGAACICTGTLIGANVVITAGHCNAGGCVDQIFIGNNVSQAGRTVKVKMAIPHPDFDQTTFKNDLTLLILEEMVDDVPPRPIASSADVDSAFSLELAGFGLTETNATGRKLVVEVTVATPNCGASVAGGFGCNENLEIVAGGNGHDSCNGDSGGPAYVKTAAGLKLAGATSRATANARVNCGDGGIYVRIDRYVDWINKTAKDNGGVLP